MSVIVNINHETGNLSQYTSTVTDLGDLSVAAGAALAGTNYGLNVLIDDVTFIYGIYDLSSADTSGKVRLRFYIDPNSLTMAINNQFTLFLIRNSSDASYGGGELKYNGASYQIRSGISDDTGTFTYTNFYNIADAPHYIEVYFIRAATNISADGSMQLWIDGVDKQTVSGIDNYDRFVDFDKIRFGAVTGVDAGTSGTFYLDELIVNNDGGIIGPVGTVNLLAGKLDRRGKL